MDTLDEFVADNPWRSCGADPETGNPVSVCNRLNLVMSGRDEEDLQANIDETMRLLFGQCLLAATREMESELL
jgi:hypothetical protein